MWNQTIRWLVGCCLVLAGVGTLGLGEAIAQPPAARLLTQPSENVVDAIWFLEDPDGVLSIDNIRSGNTPESFRRWDPALGDLNLSFSSSAWWIRVRLARGAESPQRWILDVPYAFNKFIDFYPPDGQPVLTGHARPLINRPLLSPHFAFPVALTDEPRDYFFRVTSNFAVSFALVAWQPDAYAQHALANLAVQALYHGALLAMVVYALFIGGALRDPRFGLFALYGFVLSLAMLAGNGWGGILVWPNRPAFDEMASALFLCFTAASLLLFVMRVVEAKKTLPRALHRLLVLGALAAAIQGIAMIAAVGQDAIAPLLLRSLVVTGLCAVVLISLTLWNASRITLPGKRFFVASWLVVSAGAFLASFRVVGWVPSNLLTTYAVQIATTIEMVLLSLMLIQMVRSERRQRLTDQAQMIEALKQQEQRLERAVAERTQTLVETAQRERRTLSEYLRFAALVSHEFRNGLNVISAQSDVLKKLATDIAVGQRAEVIRQHVERLARLTDTWLRSDQRLNAPAPPQLEAVDCSTWIGSVIAKQPDGYTGQQIRWSVDDGAATIWADRQSLETVLLNLLSNACKYSAPGSRIEVRTRHKLRDDGVRFTGLQVEDEGAGIEAALQSKIFDRYFRVHPEGPVSGTGLGLSLVRHIAEQYGGEVELDSVPGRGSRFIVWFPDQP